MRTGGILGLCLVGCVMATTAKAEVTLPRLFSDGMVLQAEAAAPVWGRAAPGAAVRVGASWSSETLETRADDRGAWRVDLPTRGPGGPHTITVTAGDATRTISDVLLGEVWLAGGQSNMEMPVEYRSRSNQGAIGWERAVAESADPMLRFFDVPNRFSVDEQSDVDGAWIAASPETTGDFSATAYFFARDLRRRLGVPVGIVCSSRGGTPAEAWTPLDTLERFDSAREGVDEVRRARQHPDGPTALYDERRDRWYAGLDARDPGIAGAWCDGPPKGPWRESRVPGYWEREGLPGFNGLVWYRRDVDLPARWLNRPLTLELGPIDDEDVTFANGVEVGASYGEGLWETPRCYAIPADVNTRPTLSLATRVLDTGGGGGFHGDAEDMLLRLDETDETIPLAGVWRWRASKGLARLREALGPRDTLGRDTPSSLFNGMIAPLTPYRFRGTIWYQGEANRARAREYAQLFPALIEAWRARFEHAEMPFLFVQIAPFRYAPDTGNTAQLRESQRRSLRTPHTAMVVTMDIGDEDNIHPRRKREVGERLALAAFARVYGLEDDTALSPVPVRVEATQGGAVVRFAHTGGTLKPLPDADAITGFEARGPDGVWRPAAATIDGASIRLTADEHTGAIKAVRYLWSDTAAATLFNARGLPVAPFMERTAP